MKITHHLGGARSRIARALHLDTLRRSLGAAPEAGRAAAEEWVIIYRTATGFCCLYRGMPVDFEDMLEIQRWAEEMDVNVYYMGM
jgi:hypothetical protein